MPLHADELTIDLPLVRTLVERALPHCAHLPLTPLADQGSSNLLLRLGDELLVRLPRQPGGTPAIEKEAYWAPRLAPHLPVPVPEVVAVGEPACGYPERWSVFRWIGGDRPEPGAGGQATGLDLARFLLALRDIPPPTAPDPALQSYRGEPLARHDGAFRADLRACRELGVELDLDHAKSVWEHATALPRPAEPRWYHGDLAGENLLVRDGRLAAVLDLGGLGVGDPAVDLVAAWEVLDRKGRAAFRHEVAIDDDEWARGRAWVLALAVMTVAYYGRTMPGRCARRLAAARAVLADPAS